jgi:hypothetical protein
LIATLHNAAVVVAQLFNRDETPGEVSQKAQIAAVVGTVLFLIFVLELVRRRKLVERYALLWMLIAIFGVVLAIWNDGLNALTDATGIQSPTNALFLLGLVAIVGVLLNFSVAISRLSEETRILAQTVSRLDAEIRELRGEGPAAASEQRGNGAPVATEEPSQDT